MGSRVVDDTGIRRLRGVCASFYAAEPCRLPAVTAVGPS